jgi:hypothetical protein
VTAQEDIEAVLGLRVWAVVGCSPDPGRDSYGVARFLLDRGYDVVPVHPSGGERFGLECFRSLAEVPAGRGIEVVDVFRRADRAGAHVDEAIALGARAVWLQLGVVDEAAAARARKAGLRVVMDRCPKIELPRLPRTG